MKVLTSKQMQGCDRAAIERHGIPEMVLMENAGVQVVDCMEEFFGADPPELIAVLCGKGNNGGDGLVVARHLQAAGRVVRVYLFATADGLSGSVAANHRIALSAGVDVVEVADEESVATAVDELVGFDCIVDALFGTGISGALRDPFADVVDAINDSGAAVVAVDLPSGLSADNGDIAGPAVVADMTVTFAAPKLCHVLPPACELVGELSVVDIGIPGAVIAGVEDALELIGPEECAAVVVPRDPDTHKGTYGRVAVVGGAVGMSGAAVLTARAALRGGAGLVYVAAPEAVAAIIAGAVVEALVRPYPGTPEGGFATVSLDPMREAVADADVLAVGPGIGASEEARQLVRALVTRAVGPVVLDADGLNAFSGDVRGLAAVGPPCVITPHPGEAGRLLGRSSAEVQSQRLRAVRVLAQDSGAVVVLKGYRSLVADPAGRVAINPTGNPGMATAGSGDVLTGIIAALIGQGVDAWRAARIGVFVHGAAGDIAARRVGEMSLIASDIIDALPEAFASVRAED